MWFTFSLFSWQKFYKNSTYWFLNFTYNMALYCDHVKELNENMCLTVYEILKQKSKEWNTYTISVWNKDGIMHKCE